MLLKEAATFEKQLELIQEIVSIKSYELGESFFAEIVKKLNQALDADYTFIGILDETHKQVESLALTDRNGLLDNFTYDLAHTPCESVIQEKACTYAKDIIKLFPKDQLLIDLGIEGYSGVPLHNPQKKASGILVCLYKTEIINSKALDAVLMIFASRISAELEHLKLRKSLEESQRLLEQKVEEEQSKNEALMHAISERDSFRDALNDSSLISITDRQGTILYANDKFIEVSKFDREELINSNHNILNSGYHPHAFWQEMWKTIVKGEPWQQEVKNKAKDGSYYWVDTSICPIRDSSGKIIQFLSIRNLINKRKNLEKHREELLSDFKDFAYLVSHEIRGPLARIMGLLQLVNDGKNTVEEQNNLCKSLTTASDEMDHTIREMVSTLSKNALQELRKKKLNES